MAAAKDISDFGDKHIAHGWIGRATLDQHYDFFIHFPVNGEDGDIATAQSRDVRFRGPFEILRP